MKGIINLLKFIGTIVGTIYGGLVATIKYTGVAIKYITQAFNLAMNMVVEMPNWIQFAMLITILISVVYTFIGRTHGKSDRE